MPQPSVRKAHKGVFLMKNWFKFFGAAAFAAVIGFALAGCGAGANVDTEGVSYTFEFRVDNRSGKTIKKVEFLNGYSAANVVFTDSLINLSNGNNSRIYSLSGFTEEGYSKEHTFLVIVTLDNDRTFSRRSGADDGSKIQVYVGSSDVICQNGDW
jgi:hypothetical protein